MHCLIWASTLLSIDNVDVIKYETKESLLEESGNV